MGPINNINLKHFTLFHACNITYVPLQKPIFPGGGKNAVNFNRDDGVNTLTETAN